MNIPIKVALFEGGERDFATLYSFIVGDNPMDELTRFLTNETYQHAPDFDPLVDRINRSLDELGLVHRQAYFGRDRWYRDEGHDVSALWAPIPVADRKHLKKPFPSLRLYCFRLDHILIVGYGGIKRTQRSHEDPVLRKALREVKHIRRLLSERIDAGTVQIVEDGFLLDGDLNF